MIVITLLSCLLFATTGSNVVTGSVYDAYSKEPLPFVNIVVKGTGIGTVTDDMGIYTLQVADSIEAFRLVYSMMGYKRAEKRVQFDKKNSIIVNIAMRMETLKIQGIIVSAKRERFKESASITPASISQKELKLLPSFIESDLMRTIEMLPGVTKSNDFSTDISVRGGGPDQNQVLIDDIPLLNPSHLFGLVSAFNVNAIRNAELLASGIPVKHDASLSSVLDIKTRGVGQEIKGLTGVVSLSALSSGLTIGSPIQLLNTNFLLTARRTYMDKLLALFHTDLPYYFYDGYMHTETRIGNWTAILSGYMGRDFLDVRDEDNSSIKIVGFDWGNKVGALNLFRFFADDGLLHFSTGWSNHNFNIRIMDTLFITSGTINVGTFGVDYSRKFKGHKITFGIKENYRPFDYKSSLQMGYTYEYEDIWSNRGMIYFEDQFSPTNKVLINGGIGLTHYYSESDKAKVHNTDIFSTYRLTGKYFLSDVLAITSSFGNLHQYVVPGGSVLMGSSFPVYYWIPLGGQYDPEVAHHYNLGCEGWFTDKYYFSMEAYYRKYNRLLQMRDLENIDTENEEVYYKTMLESGYGRAYGLDALLKKEVGRFRGWLSYTFLNTDATFGGYTFPTEWDRRHNFHLMFLSALPKNWDAGAQLTFSTGNPYTSALARFRYRMPDLPYDDENPSWVELEGKKNQVRYPPYLRLDISSSKVFYFGNNELDLKVSVFNVLNRRNVFFYYYDYDKEPPVKKPFYMLPIIPSIELVYRF